MFTTNTLKKTISSVKELPDHMEGLILAYLHYAFSKIYKLEILLIQIFGITLKHLYWCRIEPLLNAALVDFIVELEMEREYKTVSNSYPRVHIYDLPRQRSATQH